MSCSQISCGPFSRLEAIGHRLDLGTRQTLFTQGETSSAVYNVTAGMLRLSRLLPDGRRHVVGFALFGDFLGLSPAKRFFLTAEALTPASLWRFERKAFTAVICEQINLLCTLHERAIYELMLAQEHMAVLGRCTAEEKVAGFLVGLRDRYAQIGNISMTVELPMSRQDIADHLGLTIETVSRMFTRFDREKLILPVRGGVRLLDAARLGALAANSRMTSW